MAKGVQKDERSEDEDEEEDEEEEGPEGVSGGGGGGAAVKPAIEVNGEPVTPSEVPATGVEKKGKEDVVRRR